MVLHVSKSFESLHASMGKKKKATVKPFCYYCDRIFDDEAQLVQHQRSKHFKCPECPKKLNTAQARPTEIKSCRRPP